MAYDPRTAQWTPDEREESVQKRVVDITAQGSPLITQAQTRAKKAANRRGLLNSTMAVQAGEEAALGVALPIASQESQQAVTRNVHDVELGHDVGQQGRLFTQQRDLQGRLFAQQGELQNRQHDQERDLLREGLESREKIAYAGIASNERRAASTLASSFAGLYQSGVNNITSNPGIGAGARQTYLDAAALTRDSNYNLIEQLYGISLNWT